MARILFTTHTYYPQNNGVQFVTQYLAEGLSQKGYEVTVVTGTADGTSKNSTEKHNGVRIIRVNLRTKLGLYLGDKDRYLNLVRKLSSETDIMVNVCTQTAFTDLLLDHLSEFKCTRILYMHGMFDFEWHRSDFNRVYKPFLKIWKTIRWRKLYRVLGRNIGCYDSVIQLHEDDAASKFVRKHYNVEPYILENATDTEFFGEKERTLDRLICVANYKSRKNQEFVLEAIYKSDVSANAEMVFVGGRESSYLRRLRSIKKKLDTQYGTRKVEFLVGISREATVSMIKESRICLLGSEWEAYPIFIMEAMASGIPFVSTNVGRINTMPGGIVVDTPAQMGDAINKLLKDESLAASYGYNGRKYAMEHYRIEDKVNRFISIIEG